MFRSHTEKGNRRRAGAIAAASIAGGICLLVMPGLVSASDAGVIGPPPNDPGGVPTIPPIIVNPTNPGIPTIPPIIVNPTFPEPTAPDDLVQPTFPEPTAPDDLVQPTFPGPADPADPADPGAPTVDPAAPAGPTVAIGGQLPETGVDSTILVILGMTLTVGGTALVTMARRRPQAAE